MAAQTLSNYDATNGNAAAIYVKSVSDVSVKTPLGADVTAQLIAANILIGTTTPTADDAVVETFGESWADVARYALDIKTPEDAPL